MGSKFSFDDDAVWKQAAEEAQVGVDKAKLSYAEVAGEADPPIAEQLVTPNALRQRRYRERQAALRNGQALLPKTDDDSSEDRHPGGVATMKENAMGEIGRGAEWLLPN